MENQASEVEQAKQLSDRAYARARTGALIRACICFGCSIGLVNDCLGIFTVSVARGLEIGIGEFSVILTLVNIANAVFTLAVEQLMKRQRIRTVTGAGALICTIAFVAMGSFTNIIEFYVAGIAIGIGISCLSTLPVTYALQTWYGDRNGFATGLAMGFSGVVGALANPLCGMLITTMGYSGGFRVVGALFLILAVPAALTMKVGRESVSRKEQGPAAKGRSTLHLILVLSVLGMLFTIMAAFISHISVVGQDYGFSLQLASLLASVIMISNIVFKNVLGFLADRIGPMWATAVNIGCCMLGGCILLFFGSFPPAALLGALFYGSASSLFTVGIALITQYVAGSSYTSVFSKVTVIVALTYAVFIAAAGFLRDLTGSYDITLICSFIAGVLCLVLLRTLGKRD